MFVERMNEKSFRAISFAILFSEKRPVIENKIAAMLKKAMAA
jgi:hypothetical protein